MMARTMKDATKRQPPEQALETNDEGQPVYVRVQTRREAHRARAAWDRWARRQYEQP